MNIDFLCSNDRVGLDRTYFCSSPSLSFFLIEFVVRLTDFRRINMALLSLRLASSLARQLPNATIQVIPLKSKELSISSYHKEAREIVDGADILYLFNYTFPRFSVYLIVSFTEYYSIKKIFFT